MNWLLIENKGEAPVEGYTTLGYSSTRNCGVSGVIGQFGSGTKHAINILLRGGLDFHVYCGTQRIQFRLVKSVVNDGLRNDEISNVEYRIGEKAWTRTGWTTDFGSLDWGTIDMALREFISNAIDRSTRENGVFNETSVTIEPVRQCRAKSGFTRIFVEFTPEVRRYYGMLGDNFLHFSSHPQKAVPRIMEVPGGSVGKVYREGVFVRELGIDSLFDYNLSAGDIKIDECRNSSSYAVLTAISKKIGNASEEILTTILRASINGMSYLETEDLNEDYIWGMYFARPKPDQLNRWGAAWEAVAGDRGVLVLSDIVRDFVAKKGYTPISVSHRLTNILKELKGVVKTSDDILTSAESKGRNVFEATPAAIKATDWAWDVFEAANLTHGKEKPPVKCFIEKTNAACMVHGFCNNDGVAYNIDIADGMNRELRKTALEELAHWITGATDCSVDFQNILIDALMEWAGT